MPIVTVIASVLALSAPAAASEVYLGFFLKGSKPSPADKEVQARMMQEHLGNFGRQFEAGKLALAGPCADPTQIRRGIVVVTPTAPGDLKTIFNSDPFLKAGIMTMSLEKWHLGLGRVNTKFPDPNAIEENRIVVVTPYQPFSRSERQSFDRAIARVSRYGVCGWAGEPGTKWVGFFQGKEEQSLRSLFDNLSGIAPYLPKVEIFPLYAAKGALPDRPQG